VGGGTSEHSTEPIGSVARTISRLFSATSIFPTEPIGSVKDSKTGGTALVERGFALGQSHTFALLHQISEADRTIRLLEEFGPAYFKLSQFARISPVVFRAIAPAGSPSR
jgi:hypothetical protein